MKRFKLGIVLLCFILVIAIVGGCTKSEDTSGTDTGTKTGTTQPSGTAEDGDKGYKLSGKFSVIVIGEFAKDSIDPVTGARITGWDSLVKPFEEQHEGLEIDFVEIPWTDVLQKLETSAQSGTIDVMHLPANVNNRLGAKGLLEPLDKYIEEDNSFDPVGLYGSNLWNENAMVHLNGVHYGIPKSAYTFTILINTKLFDDWGVPYITDDSTYEEIVEAASKMTGKNPVTGKQNYGLFTPRGTELLRMLCTYYSKTPAYRTFWKPADPFTADISEINFVYTTNEAIAKAFNLIKEASKYMPPGWVVNEGIENFFTEDGDVAIFMPASEVNQDFKNMYEAGKTDLLKRYKTIKLPAFIDDKGNKIRGVAPVHTWGVPVTAKDKRASYEICKYLGSMEVSKKAYEEKWLTPVFREGVNWVHPDDPYTRICIEQMNESHGYPALSATSAYAQANALEIDLLHRYCKGEVTDLMSELQKIQETMELWKESAVKGGTR